MVVLDSGLLLIIDCCISQTLAQVLTKEQSFKLVWGADRTQLRCRIEYEGYVPFRLHGTLAVIKPVSKACAKGT